MPTPRTILTIGTFDGVHLGHAALVARARDEAGPDGSVVALVFDPHPMTQLAPDRTPPRLTSFDQREALLRSIGVDRVVRLEPTANLLAQDPEAFARWLVDEFAPTAIVEGRDFRFAKGQAGDLGVLTHRHAVLVGGSNLQWESAFRRVVVLPQTNRKDRPSWIGLNFQGFPPPGTILDDAPPEPGS